MLLPQPWLSRCLAGELLYGRELSGGRFPPEVGNGFVATRVQSDVIYAAGLFDGEASNKCEDHIPWCGLGTHRAAIPAYHVRAAEAPSEAPRGGCALDISDAVFMRRGLISGGEVQLDERWFAPYHEPSLLVHEIELRNLGDRQQEIQMVSQSAPPSADLDLVPVSSDRFRGDDFYTLAGTNNAPEIAGGEKTAIAIVANRAPPSITLSPRGEHVFYALSSVVTSLNSTRVVEDAFAVLRRYTKDNGALMPSLLERHTSAWRERAAHGHLEVEGDLSLAQAVNASLYYIRASVRADWPLGISPGGLASDAYNGHTFWDQETWMYPTILALEPQAARAMLQYRFDRMPQARINAQNCKPPPEGFMRMWPKFAKQDGLEPPFWTADPWHPHHGFCTDSYTQSPHKAYALYFGWETALTGVETSQMDDRYGPWAMFEQHLMGDIAFAVRQYWLMTSDLNWLRSVGFPLVNGTASFYAARLVERADGSGRGGRSVYDLPVVMGPDEYNFPVTNNAYSNAVARITLEFAAEAAGELGLSGDAYCRFSALAAGISVPRADSVPGRPDLLGGYHPEYEGFLGNASGTGTSGRVKQADTVLLNFPLGVPVDPLTLANDLEFYSGITDPNGPAMTWSMLAINYFDQKDFKKSGDMFRRGFANIEPPYGVWTEYPSTFKEQGAVNFITGAGGFLQSLTFGTSGMRITREGLKFDPPPPSATGTAATGFTLHSLHYLGSRIRQEVTEDAMSFELLQQESDHAPALCLTRDDRLSWAQFRVGQSVHMPRVRVTIAACGDMETEQSDLLLASTKREASTRIWQLCCLSLVTWIAFTAFLIKLRSLQDWGSHIERDSQHYEAL